MNAYECNVFDEMPKLLMHVNMQCDLPTHNLDMLNASNA